MESMAGLDSAEKKTLWPTRSKRKCKPKIQIETKEG